MGAKRKKSDMALLAQNVPTDESSVPERPSDAPRRSGRKVSKPGQEPGQGPVRDFETAKQDFKRSNTRRTRLRQQKDPKEDGGDGVDIAMEGLREMEDTFRDAVKRQKLAVGESSCLGEIDTEEHPEQVAFLPRPTKQAPEVMSARENKGLLGKAADVGDEAAQGPILRPVPVEKEDGDYVPEEADANTLKLEGARPPPVNSEYLPLPWKGRLGYACLNTYLRQANPAVFSSRTCRISSILEHRHPLEDPTQPEHTTKNRPDKTQPADVARGQKYVENLGLANARDIVKMIRWNDRYGIRFMRLSSEMFPFASHEEYGYKLAPFASETLAAAGRLAGELGHRLTTHPGQFTQLGSPRKEVVKNAVRDLEYHDELLSLLKLPEQQNRDAVMILHMGGVFGDKEATLDRFRENYGKLAPSIKARLVLENDDVSWSVHDLLPICEELNIPLVLDFHHHNIIFDADEVREGTKDIMKLYSRIKATWDRKRIKQKMHYSEPCPEAITGRQRRKHSPRVATLPPCPDDMDLMIEAKDKEQAVFTLMRTFRLPGWDSFNDVVPYMREDENTPAPKPTKKQAQAKKKISDGVKLEDSDQETTLPVVSEEELNMGGPVRRVYWPQGMEEWLRPKKREVKKKAKKTEAED